MVESPPRRGQHLVGDLALAAAEHLLMLSYMSCGLAALAGRPLPQPKKLVAEKVPDAVFETLAKKIGWSIR